MTKQAPMLIGKGEGRCVGKRAWFDKETARSRKEADVI